MHTCIMEREGTRRKYHASELFLPWSHLTVLNSKHIQHGKTVHKGKVSVTAEHNGLVLLFVCYTEE